MFDAYHCYNTYVYQAKKLILYNTIRFKTFRFDFFYLMHETSSPLCRRKET